VEESADETGSHWKLSVWNLARGKGEYVELGPGVGKRTFPCQVNRAAREASKV